MRLDLVPSREQDSPVYRSWLFLLPLGLLIVSGSAAGQSAGLDLVVTLHRAGEQLEQHYQRSQRIVSTEEVWVRSFRHDMQSNGSPRRLRFEHRLEWGMSESGDGPTVSVRRELQSVNGREPRPQDVDGCLTPLAEDEDPLSALLPNRQRDFEFSVAEVERVEGREVARLEYVPLDEGVAEVIWEEGCVSISLPGWMRGEVWVDVESGVVLRLDQHLMRRFEFQHPPDSPRGRRGRIALERSDLSIRYHRVSFRDPDETLMLPRSVERNWVLQGSGFVPRYYRSQEYSNYRRFVTGGRLVPTPDAASDR
jgi:hypothetical protein